MAKEIEFISGSWTGIIDADITNKSIAKTAQAFADFLIHHSTEKDILKVAVAHDGRMHSKPWALLFARILSGNSIIVYLSDKIGPTPVLSYFVKSNKLHAGVMISGGNLPQDYNGVFLKNNHGGPFSSVQTDEIVSLIDKELVQADDEKIFQTDLRAGYNEHLQEEIDFDAIKDAGIKVLLDSMAGAGQQVLETMFLIYDISGKTIYKIAEKDFSNRLPDPAEANLQPLKDEITRDDYAIGIATSGDGRAVGVITDEGEYLDQQEVAILLADYIKNGRKTDGDIIKTFAVTDRLNILFQDSNVKSIEVPDSFGLSKKMFDEQAAFGCNEKGNFYYKNNIYDSDGLFSALLLIEMLAKSGYNKLSNYVKEKRKVYGRFYSGKSDITKENAGFAIISLRDSPPETIGNYKVVSFREVKNESDELVGLKFTFEENAGTLMISNSAEKNILKIYAESEGYDAVQNLILSVKDLLG